MSSRKKLSLTIILFLAAMLFMLPKHAFAVPIGDDAGGNGIGGVSPAEGSGQNYAGNTSAGNFFSAGSSVTPYYDIGNNNSDYTYSDIRTKVYVKTGTSISISIDNAAANCNSSSGGGVVGPDYTENGGLPTTTFTLIGANGTIGSPLVKSTGGCTLYFLASTSVTSSNAFSITATNNYDGYYWVDAKIPQGTLGQGENQYRVQVDTSNAVVGAGANVFGLGYRAGNLNNGNYYSAWSNFALPLSCAGLTDNSTFSAVVSYLDADTAHTDWNTQMIFEVQSQSVDNNNNLGAWTTIATQSQTAGQIVDAGQNNLHFTADYSHRYRLVMGNIGVRNTIRVIIPNQFSTLYAKLSERPTTNTCGGQVSCSTNPNAQTVSQSPGSASIVINGTSTAAWKSTYYIKRTGPSYKTLTTSATSATTGKATDNVTYTGTTPVTYTYVVYDSSNNTQVSPGSCTATINWTPPNQTPGVTCTATATNSNPAVGTATSINFTIHNNGTTNLQGDQVRQKASDSANTGAVWPQTGFGNFSQGQQASFTFPVSSRGTATVVTFSYTLYSGTTAGDPPVVGVQNPLPCNVTITWGNSPPVGNLKVACGQTTIPGMTSTATYQHTTTTTTPGTPYLTGIPPTQWPLWPWPPGPPPATPQQILSGTVWTYTPPSGTTTTTVTLPATEVPYYINFVGSDGSNQNSNPAIAGGNPSGQFSVDTFNTYNFLRPHVSYTATLYAQLSGSLGSEQSGPYGNWTPVGSAQALGTCLSAGVCLGGNSPTATPGQTVSSTYQIRITNNTNRSFDPGVGYNLFAHPDGQGLVGSGSMSQAVSVPQGQNNISGTFNFVVTYQGTYWVEFRYGGTTVGTQDNSWPGTCGSGADSTPPVTVTPQIAPYFQVWQNDAAGGGSFRTVDLQCPNTYPTYVSPPTKGSSFAGGIRAMSSATIQSKSDFGAVAMGLIPNPSGEGFYARNNAYFANSGMPSGLGGYLNSTSANHCVDDYYTNTQVDPGTTPTIGDLQAAINGCPLDTSTNAYRCQFQMSPTTISEGRIFIPAGRQITIYVNGNVTLDSDVVYQEPFNPNDRSTIPYFAIIAKGNITLTANVTRLDGLYVAQPSGAGSGVFATCDSNCSNQLVINGSVIAQHVELLRSHGSSQPLSTDPNGIGTNPAEIINFVPSMILGAPMFNPQPITPEGLFSLPPVF